MQAVAPSDTPDLSALSPLASALASTVASLAGDVALVLDGDGVIRSVADGLSPAVSACAGWTGRRWVETATADTRGKLEQMLAEVQSGGVARRREINHTAPEGAAMPLAWSALRLGRSGPVIALGRDLREVAAIQQRFLDVQQELERAYWQRREGESRDALLDQVAHEALFLLDATTLRVLEANDAALALVRQDRLQARGRFLSELLPATTRAAVGSLLAAARSSARAGEIRARLVEHEAPLGWAATPFRAPQGPRLLLRARREPALRAAAAAREPRAVLLVDAAARMHAANGAALRDLQWADEAQVRAKSLTDVVAAESAGRWQAVVERARAEGLVCRVPMGREFETPHVTAALLTEGEQELVGLVWVPLGTSRPRAAAPAESLHRLAAQLGQASLPQLLALGRAEQERHLIAAALWRGGGDSQEAARWLGISVEQLERRMRRLGLPAPGAVE
jgi:transcriptional regulator PpsR